MHINLPPEPVIRYFIKQATKPGRFEQNIITCSGEDEEYLLRWKLLPTNKVAGTYLHNFKRPDVPVFHDHPWWFASIVLLGSYTEYRPGEKPLRRRPGDVMFRSAEAAHWVDHLEGDVWTLVLRGPVVRDWGFWTNQGWMFWKDYLAMEHHERSKVR